MSLTDTARPFSTGLGEQVDEAGDWMTMPRRPAPDTLGPGAGGGADSAGGEISP